LFLKYEPFGFFISGSEICAKMGVGFGGLETLHQKVAECSQRSSIHLAIFIMLSKVLYDLFTVVGALYTIVQRLSLSSLGGVNACVFGRLLFTCMAPMTDLVVHLEMLLAIW
jgi:hypothetical protein